MKLKSTIAMTAIAAALMGVSGAASAAAVQCGVSEIDPGKACTSTTSGNISGAAIQASPYSYNLLDLQSGWSAGSTGTSNNGSAQGSLGASLNTGSVIAGTWSFNPNLWNTYGQIFLGIHWGGQGGGQTDIIELNRADSSGTFRRFSGVNGLSNLYLLTKGECTENCGNVPVPGTIALLGLGMLGLGAARRKLA